MKAVLASKDASNLGQRSYSVRRIQDNLTIALFLAPAFLFFFAFQVYPIFQSIYYSFFNWKGFGPAVDFVGLDNYGRALTDPIFLKGVWNGILIVFFSLLVQLPLSMALALLVARNMPGRVFFRTVFFLPFVFSEVITAVIWASLFKPDPQIGLINALLVLIPGVQPQSFLGNPNTVLACIFVALSWKYFGFHMLLFLAGLQNIPQEIEEAARIDGANGIQLRYPAHIYLPVCSGVIAAVRIGMDHERGWAGQCQRNDGDLYVSYGFCPLFAGIWRCGWYPDFIDCSDIFVGLPVFCTPAGLSGRVLERTDPYGYLFT